MSEPPHDDRTDDPAGSAPWERPRRWNQQRLDATRVDDLLARLGNEDEMGGRRRRRRAAEGAPTDPGQGTPDAESSAEHVTEVSASELIAALQQQRGDGSGTEPDPATHTDAAPESGAGTDTAADAGTAADAAPAAVEPDVRPPSQDAAPTGSAAPAGPAEEPSATAVPEPEPAASSAAPSSSEGPAPQPPTDETARADGSGSDAGNSAGTGTHDSDSEKTAVIAGGAAAAAAAAAATSRRGGRGGPGVVSMPGYDDSRTDQLPQIGPFEDVASIRESLRRQHAGDSRFADTAAGPTGKAGKQETKGKGAAPVGATALAGGSSTHRGMLWAGRSVIALIAAAVLVVVGIEWNIWTTHNNTLAAENEANKDVLDTADSNIATPSSQPPASGDEAPGAPGPPLPQYEPENILLLGSDTRAGGNADETNSTGADSGAQSDTLMIAHLSADRQNITILSVPRDLQIPAPECRIWDSASGKVSDEIEPVTDSSRWKITNAYAVGGPKCTVSAVQALTGLRIDRVIVIDFNGFKSMVDALDGINLNVCKRIYDQELGLIVAEGGEQLIRGDQALSLVRARKVADDGYGNDYGRIHRQQVVLSAILRQVTSSGTMLNPGKLDGFLTAFVDATDTVNIDLDVLVDLASQLGGLDPERITFYTLPAHDNPNDGGDTQLLDEETSQAVFTALVNDQRLPGEAVAEPPATTGTSPAETTAGTSGSSAASTTGSSTPATSAPTSSSSAPEPQVITVEPADVDLQIVNVTGGPGIATNAQNGLNSLGFNVPDELLLRLDDEATDTVSVQYSEGNREAGLTVAAAVPGAVLVEVPGLGSRVRLMLGTGYSGDLAEVYVGQDVPTSLRTTPEGAQGGPSTASSGTSSPQVPVESTPRIDGSDGAGIAGGGTSVAGPSTPASPSITLQESDLEKVNAGVSSCA